MNRQRVFVNSNVLLSLLFRTEEEIGEDNLKELTIPEDLQKKFDETLDEDQG